jgi:hypothetical protein
VAKVSPESDPQREEVYVMEKKGLPGLHLAYYPRATHRLLLKKLTKVFGVPTTSLQFLPQKDCAGMYQYDSITRHNRIVLSTAYKAGTSPITLVHEFAHHVMAHWDPEDRLFGHGPEWVGVYGDCLAMAGLVPYDGFRSLCNQYGVLFLDTELAQTIPQLRKMVKKRAAEAAQGSHHHKDGIILRL